MIRTSFAGGINPFSPPKQRYIKLFPAIDNARRAKIMSAVLEKAWLDSTTLQAVMGDCNEDTCQTLLKKMAGAGTLTRMRINRRWHYALNGTDVAPSPEAMADDLPLLVALFGACTVQDLAYVLQLRRDQWHVLGDRLGKLYKAGVLHRYKVGSVNTYEVSP